MSLLNPNPCSLDPVALGIGVGARAAPRTNRMENAVWQKTENDSVIRDSGVAPPRVKTPGGDGVLGGKGSPDSSRL